MAELTEAAAEAEQTVANTAAAAQAAADAAEHAAQHAGDAAEAAIIAATSPAAMRDADEPSYAAAAHEHDGYALRADVTGISERLAALESRVSAQEAAAALPAETEHEAVVQPPAPEPEPPAKEKRKWLGLM